MRRKISLNFGWEYLPEFKNDYIGKKVLETAEIVNIPHTMKEVPLNYFNEQDYQLIGTYSKVFYLEEEYLKNNIFIEFKAVMTVAKVYLNGELLFIHEGGYTPFSVNITDKANQGENLLQVIVDSNEIKDIPPFGKFIDYLCFSGIYREVNLLIKPKVFIEKCHVSTDEANVFHRDEMTLNIDLSLNEEVKNGLKVRGSLISEDKTVFENVFSDKILKSENYFSTIKGIKRWDIENPYLYTLKIEILDNEIVLDTIFERVGFRTVKFTAEGFLLNNEPLKLIGLNRHQSYPYVGYAMPKSIQELDADILKEFGCNIVRTSHYMQSDHFLNRCDELGLLVLEEIPGWQYIGNDHFKELSLENLKVMITNHYNHPSIVTWGVRINESFDDHEFYQKTNDLARKLDPTRQTSGIRNSVKGDFLEDIYTYNDFSHVGNNPGLEKVKNVVRGYKPYLVTEHNGHVFPTKKTDSEARRKEQALRHTTVIDHAFSSKRYSGAIGWCLADYNTHFNFGSNDRICHHGVMDMFRIPKYAAYTYKAQRNDEPFLFIASNLIPGDYEEFKLPETVVFTNCDYIKLYKNDEFISDYYQDWEDYPSIPNAPIIFRDHIGDLIVNSGRFKEKDAKKITKLFIAYSEYGFNMPLKYKLMYLDLTRRKILNHQLIMELSEEYIALQKAEHVVFRFEGYKDDKLVITKKIGHTDKAILKVGVAKTELVHGFTYDATRVLVRLTDEFDNDLQFSNDTIKIDVSNNLELIGPDMLSIQAGSCAFYVKTKNPGKATIKIYSSRNQVKKIDLTIKPGSLEY